MVITDSFHSDIEGKNYKFGTPNKLNKTSKPLILFYFVQDYKRNWDEANPLNYDDPQLKNDAIVTKIESEGDVLNISLFDYESLDETELRFEVGKETSISKVVDENDHTKEYKFIPTKIVVDDSLEKGSKIYDELIETVWTNYYIKNSKEGEKIPKVAENVENLSAEGHSHNKSSYKKCAECSDSVFELEEEICFECSSFGAEYEKTDDERILGIHNGNGNKVGTVSIEDVSNNKDKVFISIDGYNEEDEHGWHPMIWDGVIPESPFNAETKVFNASMYKCPDCSFIGYQDEFLEPIDEDDDEGKIIYEANAKTGNKVYIITRRCEDYSAYRELDVAGFGSLTEARKKFNILFKEAKKQDYADYTIADAKYYMSWGEYWGIMSFNDGEMIYELREVIVGEKGDFYFDAETFESKGYSPDKPFYITWHSDKPTAVMHPIKCGHYKMVMKGTGVWDSPTFYDTIEEMFTNNFDAIMDTQIDGLGDWIDTEQGQEFKRQYQAIKTIGDARKFAKNKFDFKIDFAPCFRKERDYDSKALNALPITVFPIYEEYFEAETFGVRGE